MQRVRIGIVEPHRPHECKGLRILDRHTRQPVPQLDALCARVWASLSEHDRLNFHKASCLNQMSTNIQMTMQTVSRKLKEAGLP